MVRVSKNRNGVDEILRKIRWVLGLTHLGWRDA